MKKVAICTISSHNYMAYGLTCLLSAGKYNKNADLFYLIADEFSNKYYMEFNERIKFVDIYSIGIEKNTLINMAFKYNIVEFNTCIKPAFYSYLFKQGYDSVIYLDPDIECYSSFDNFLSRNKDYSIIVTPHKTTSYSSSLIEDKAFLNNGIYNLGFIALNKSHSTHEFLTWWDDKLKDQCFIDYQTGLATDQIWVELASTIFAGFHVDKDYGLNVAFWNIHERKIYKKENKWIVNDNPLVFFHFSSLSKNCSTELLENLEGINKGFLHFYREHISNVDKFKTDFSKISYSFSKFDNGEVVSKETRWLYGFSPYLQEKYSNPFSTDGDSFYKQILKKHRILKRQVAGNEKFFKLLVNILGTKRAIEKFSFGSIQIVKHISKLFSLS